MKLKVRQLRCLIREEAQQLDLPGIESPAFSQDKLDRAYEHLKQVRKQLAAAKTPQQKDAAGKAFQKAMADVQQQLGAHQEKTVQPSLKAVYGGSPDDPMNRNGLGT